jgi:hypothetical protein
MVGVSAASAPLREHLPSARFEGNLGCHIGFGSLQSMRIGHKALLILRFFPDSALSEALKPQGTYAQPNRYPVSTQGKPRYSGGVHFFCNKIANGG